MKAVIYDKSNFPNTLVLRDVEKPIPNDYEVLVKIYDVSVNAADYRSMKMGIIPKKKVFGADIAGRIEAVGKHVKKFTVGNDVFGDLSDYGFGGFAEYAVVPEKGLVIKPASVSFITAASLPMAALTALQALRNKGNIQSGQKVLICGSGGGVGTFAVQLAKYFEAEVTAVCGEHNVEITKSIGADHIINYNEKDFSDSGIKYDIILGVNGNYSLSAYKRSLTKSGIFVMIGGSLSQVARSLVFGAFMSVGSKKMRSLAAKTNIIDLEFIIKLVEDGKIKPIIDRCYPLHETAEAVRYLSGGHAQGKVIIEVV